MQYLTLMIKPASGLCNMNCRYCFYRDVSESRAEKSFGIMNADTVSVILERVFEAAENGVRFIFQGGEPTLAGLDFFKSFAEKVKAANNKGIVVSYSVQTNGLNIDEDFASFFAENRFLVGLSLDGYAELHDFFRPSPGEQPTHARVMKTAKLFDKHKVEYNILAVVTAQSAKHGEKVYNFFKTSGLRYLQFIPCLAPLGEDPFALPHALTPELYEDFLICVFKKYYEDFMAGDYISVRLFDNLVNIAAGHEPEQCGTLGFCPGQLVIEADGSVFPCDFYCSDYWRVGNIKDMSVAEIAESDKMREFRTTSLHGDERCRDCDVFYLCRGGCRRDRDLSVSGSAGENIYCDALYNFYKYAEPYLAKIVQKLRIGGV
ncbi:MAG: anaerobic sulfatase maturase [Acutalibacteraceae bacterium]|jgi:uncharacterized protein